MFTMLEQVLDFDGDVKSELREFAMQRFCEHYRVPNAIEKIRIAEGDVLRPRRHLLANVFEHDFAVHYAKDAVVDGYNRTVTAKVLASPARFRTSRNTVFAGGEDDMSVVRGQRQAAPHGSYEFLPRQRDQG